MIDNSCYFKQVPNISTVPVNNTSTSVNISKETPKFDTFEGRTKGASKTWLKNDLESYAGFKKLKDKFSDEEIKQFNDKKELPKGYYLKAVNKLGDFPGSVKVEDGKMPSALVLVKLPEEKALKIKNKGKFISDKMPDSYKLVNGTNGKTYLLSEKHKDFQSTRKWIKQDILFVTAVLVSTLGSVFGILRALDKMGKI